MMKIIVSIISAYFLGFSCYGHLSTYSLYIGTHTHTRDVLLNDCQFSGGYSLNYLERKNLYQYKLKSEPLHCYGQLRECAPTSAEEVDLRIQLIQAHDLACAIY